MSDLLKTHHQLLAREVENGYGSTEQSSSEESLLQETTFNTEIAHIGKSSGPLIITFFLQYSLTVMSIFSVGHIGKTELAAVSLATMTFNICNAVFNGMATCLDTFCSQAYGAGKYHLVGTQFQRGAAMVLAIAIPINILWWCSSFVLNIFVENKELCDLAQLYLRIISFGSPGYILFETGKRFLQAQGIFHAGQYVLFICTPLNGILNYVLVWNSTFGIGYAGAPLATAITFTTMAVLLLLYVLFVEGKKCWGGLKIKESFQHWGPMAKLALPGVVMIEAEFLAFEILTLSAARFGTETLAAQSIVSTISTLMFQIPFGVSVAGSTRIASHVGSQSIFNSSIAVKVSMGLSFLIGSITCSSLYLGRKTIVHWFTEDQSVAYLAANAIRILSVNQLYDTINVIAAGCLRGQGRQYIGSNLNLLSYYSVALPLAFYLAFWRDMQLIGLWLGLGAGILVLSTSETYYVFHANWKQILKDADDRTHSH